MTEQRKQRQRIGLLTSTAPYYGIGSSSGVGASKQNHQAGMM